LRKTAFGSPLLKMTKKSYSRTFKGMTMKKTTFKDVVLACLFGLVGGASLALVYVYRTGGF
jgi:hypothetical protein